MARRTTLALAFILTIPLCLGAAASAPLRIDDVVALLKAGVGEKVILKQIEVTRTRLTMTVEAMLQLKAVGATDAFLEALMGAPADGGAPGPAAEAPAAGAPSFRMYTEQTGDGETVLHITNLDANGRRIGGEVEAPSQRNVVQPPAPLPAEPVSYEYDDEPEPPVIVNVYPPGPSDLASGYPTGAYVSPYAGGLYPGYGGAFYGYTPSHHAHGPHCGHHVGPYYSPYAPPGSYSHFVQYHHSNRSHFTSIPSAINVAPYRYGNAAARNRAAFRRR